MHIRVRKFDRKADDEDLIVPISKSSSIRDLLETLSTKISVDFDRLKLYYQGKQLVGEHCLLDYNIGYDNVVQMMISPVAEKKIETNKSPKKNKLFKAKSRYYQINDQIDFRDENGAWFEARILEIYSRSKSNRNSGEIDEKLIYKVQMDRGESTTPFEVKSDEIRPRSFYKYQISELREGMTVLANYNMENSKSRGYWFDFKIEKIFKKSIIGKIYQGAGCLPLEYCAVSFIDELMQIENPILLNEKMDDFRRKRPIPIRKIQFNCAKCKDNSSRDCRYCGCKICRKKSDPGKTILCDECDGAYHLSCLTPPLEAVPEDPEWYCPQCKIDENEIVRAGEKLKVTKKKSIKSTKEWGKGMACVGRTKECTVVPKNHFGPIPGIDVGMCWKFRLQVSEAGVHRPHVAGIHGRESDGAYSIVLSGGYEDDVDNGDEFYYTGSGGRDLTGNKRVSAQCSDQKLTRMNKALAMNCNAPINVANGAEAIKWRMGKPVRVVRNYNLRKHSNFAPINGNRYDGIYKVVKYFPEKGLSGFVVWRFLLRRDDPSPAPWHKNGKEFEIIYPSGYLEAEAVKNGKVDDSNKRSKKSDSIVSLKKMKFDRFELDREISKLIELDEKNSKLWVECKEVVKLGKLKFFGKVEEVFMCVCCQDLVDDPITIDCAHNVCRTCLHRSFAAKIYNCPCCRFEMGVDYQPVVNLTLKKILQLLFKKSS